MKKLAVALVLRKYRKVTPVVVEPVSKNADEYGLVDPESVRERMPKFETEPLTSWTDFAKHGELLGVELTSIVTVAAALACVSSAFRPS